MKVLGATRDLLGDALYITENSQRRMGEYVRIQGQKWPWGFLNGRTGRITNFRLRIEFACPPVIVAKVHLFHPILLFWQYTWVDEDDLVLASPLELLGDCA